MLEFMKSNLLSAAVFICVCQTTFADKLAPIPTDPFFAKFQPIAAPVSKTPVLRAGDRLAICGDSITEQKLYSRILETYITVALPELAVSTRQYGWGGEQAWGFLARMTNDVLRFKPTVATTCYGMNDHHYRPYEPGIGTAYASNTTVIVDAFKAAGTRVVLGSPGCMGLKPPPYKGMVGSEEERNLSLCTLRNIDIRIAESNHVVFADVFWPMFLAQFHARQLWSDAYTLAGKDSIHPAWAGHLVMAYCFLKALDVPGDIGTFTIDLKSDRATVSPGHQLVSCKTGTMTVKSFRYPFCATGSTSDPDSIRSGMALVPFNEDFNRLLLVVKHAKAPRYKVTWGDASHVYSSSELKHGVNLAADFSVNPFSSAFAAVDDAVAKKQAYETKQIKEMFHGAAGKADMEKTVAETEEKRAELADAIKAAFIPVTHSIIITPE
jgi:hypothetical protein